MHLWQSDHEMVRLMETVGHKHLMALLKVFKGARGTAYLTFEVYVEGAGQLKDALALLRLHGDPFILVHERHTHAAETRPQPVRQRRQEE